MKLWTWIVRSNLCILTFEPRSEKYFLARRPCQFSDSLFVTTSLLQCCNHGENHWKGSYVTHYEKKFTAIVGDKVRTAGRRFSCSSASFVPLTTLGVSCTSGVRPKRTGRRGHVRSVRHSKVLHCHSRSASDYCVNEEIPTASVSCLYTGCFFFF